MQSRQAIGTFNELWHMHGGEVYLLRFRPDQRFDALMCLDRWFLQKLVTRAKFQVMSAFIHAYTWEHMQ